MDEARYLRRQAQRCFRLARSINSSDVIAELERMGREFECHADKIERAVNPRNREP
jgi:hypothetical protein